MTAQFDESQHRRDGGGRFSEKDRAEASVALDVRTAPGHDPDDPSHAVYLAEAAASQPGGDGQVSIPEWEFPDGPGSLPGVDRVTARREPGGEWIVSAQRDFSTVDALVHGFGAERGPNALGGASAQAERDTQAWLVRYGESLNEWVENTYGCRVSTDAGVPAGIHRLTWTSAQAVSADALTTDAIVAAPAASAESLDADIRSGEFAHSGIVAAEARALTSSRVTGAVTGWAHVTVTPGARGLILTGDGSPTLGGYALNTRQAAEALDAADIAYDRLDEQTLLVRWPVAD